MTAADRPRTTAGRRIFDEKPVGWTGQAWRAAVLAIEAEARRNVIAEIRERLRRLPILRTDPLPDELAVVLRKFADLLRILDDLSSESSPEQKR